MVSDEYAANFLRNATKEEYFDFVRRLCKISGRQFDEASFDDDWDEWCALKHYKTLH